jgi:Rrf2 family protein
MVTNTGYVMSSIAMKVTRATDYAVRVLVQLATLPEGQKMQLNTLAVATGVRESFLSKILQRLAHQGLVSSHRGTGGGFCLRVLPSEVTLLQVIEAMEGRTQLNVCLGEGDFCDQKSCCAAYPVWQKAQAALTHVLASVSIAQLAEQTAALQRQAMEPELQAGKASTAS